MSDARLQEPRAGNIMGKKKIESNPQTDFYNYMLRKEKLRDAEATGTVSGGEALSIMSLGALEKWELKALARLYRLGDNSPELLQYLHITNSTTRDECAKKLARKQYKKQIVETTLSKLLSPDEVRNNVVAEATQSRNRAGLQAFGL